MREKLRTLKRILAFTLALTLIAGSIKWTPIVVKAETAEENDESEINEETEESEESEETEVREEQEESEESTEEVVEDDTEIAEDNTDDSSKSGDDSGTPEESLEEETKNTEDASEDTEDEPETQEEQPVDIGNVPGDASDTPAETKEDAAGSKDESEGIKESDRTNRVDAVLDDDKKEDSEDEQKDSDPVDLQGSGLITMTDSLLQVDAGNDEDEIVPMAAGLSIASSEIEYTGDAILIADLELKLDGAEIDESVYEITIEKDNQPVTEIKDAGEYTITVTNKNDSTDLYQITLKVLKKNLSDAKVTIGGTKDCTYTGTDQTFDGITVQVDGVDWGEGDDYTVEYENNTEVTSESNQPKVIIKPTENGGNSKNYQGSAEKTFAINYAELGEGETYTLDGPKNEGVDGWYTGTVTITAPDGWNISTDRTDWTQNLTVISQSGDGVYTGDDAVKFWLKNQTTGGITDVQSAEFSIDGIFPVVVASLEKQNGEDVSEKWTSSKTIKVEVTEANLESLYYTVGDSPDKHLVTINSGSNEYTVEITDEIGADAIDYIFYAVDKAGNLNKIVSGNDPSGAPKTEETVSLKMIDLTAPNAVKAEYGDKQQITSGDTIYFPEMKTGESQTITLTFEDNSEEGKVASGIVESGIGVTCDSASIIDECIVTEKADGTVTAEITFKPDDYAVSEKKSYSVTIKDQAGNDGRGIDFTICYDAVAPAIQNDGLSDSDNKAIGEWINGDNGTITWKLTLKDYENDVNETASGIDSIKVWAVEDGTETEVTKDVTITGKSGDKTWTVEVKIPETDFEGTYDIEVSDIAGNSKKLSEIPGETAQTIKVDREVDNISSVAILGPNNEPATDKWYRANTADNKVRFEITMAGDESSKSGISKVIAFADDQKLTETSNADQKAVLESLSENNVTDLITQEPEKEAGSYILELSDDAKDKDFGIRTYWFYVYDNAGNVTSYNGNVSLKRDSTLPMSDTEPSRNTVYVSYTTTDDTNDSVSNSLFGIAVKALNKLKNHIFAKTNVTVTLYVPDTVAGDDQTFSGVSSIVMKYNGKEESLDAKQGVYYAIQGENSEAIENSGYYSMIETTLSVSEGENIADSLRILEVTDAAGNVRKPADGSVLLTSGNMIVIDGVSPILQKAEYSHTGKEAPVSLESDKDYKYYFNNGDSTVELGIVEHNFFTEDASENGTRHFPDFTLYERTVSGENVSSSWSENVSVKLKDWEKDVQEEDQANSSLTLPKETEEKEYYFTLGYKDPSGNKMQMASGYEGKVDADGVYTSAKIVVDTKAPILTQFDITAANNDSLLRYPETGNVYYAENISGDDVVLTVSIDDNPAYFNAAEVYLEYQNQEDGSDWVRLEQNLKNTDWKADETDVRIHTATYTFDGKGSYKFRITYADRAGNQMVPTANEVQSSTENTKYFESIRLLILDETNPVLTSAVYTGKAAGYTTGDVTKEANGNAVVLNESAKDTTGTYYFNNKTTTMPISIQEHYFFAIEGDANDPVVKPEYTLSRDGAELPKEEQPGLVWKKNADTADTTLTFKAETGKEYEYTFKLGYADPAGNLLAKQGDVVGSLDKGVYESRTIVVDTRAPELTQFEIVSNGGSLVNDPENRDNWYAENLSEDDILVKVGIDDNDKYFDASYVVVEYCEDEGVWTELSADRLVDGWSNSGRLHTASYAFDGAADEEHTYQFRVSYEDRAGNALTLPEENAPDVTSTKAGQRTYVSKQNVIIDHVTPELNTIRFSKPVQMFDKETLSDNGKAVTGITNGQTRLYYSESAAVDFNVNERYLFDEDIKVTVYKRADKQKAFTDQACVVYAGTEIKKKESQNGLIKDYAYSFTMPDEDAEYYFTISYTDKSGNQMVYSSEVTMTRNLKEAHKDFLKNGIYTAPVMVLDKTTPKFDVSYKLSEGDDLEAYNSVSSVTATVKLTEMNLDLDKTILNVTAVDVNGESVTCSEVTKYDGKTWEELIASGAATVVGDGDGGKLDKQTLTLRFSTQANYVIRVASVDKVKKTASYSKKFCVDRKAPTIRVKGSKGNYTNEVKVESGLLEDDSDITYSVVSGGKIATILNKVTFGYFDKEKIVVHITAHDQTSGVKEITYTYKDNDSGAEKTATVKASADKKDKSVGTYDLTLPISFKGTVKAHGTDVTGNAAKDSGAIGVIAENEATHADRSSAGIVVLSDSPKTEDYYTGDVDIRFSVKDNYSGLNSVKYTAGNDLVNDEVSYAKEGEKIVTTEENREYTIAASSNNENNIVTALSYIDNAGHEGIVPEDRLPVIHIDTTDPVITVEYDNHDVQNEKYYKAPRTATVTIEERNFDPDDVDLDITGPVVSVSGWSHHAGSGCDGGSDSTDTGHTDSCEWSCDIVFSEDGDYTFTCSCTDLAGNSADYGQTDEFTVDKTFPEISVSYDNNSFANEFYYNAPRVATISIDEHNFNPAEVEVTMTARDNGAVIGTPGVSGWSDSGDVHTARISYDYDGEFTFDISYTDMAGNEAEDYTEDHFIVDLTEPAIEFVDIENMSANNGVVAPGIQVADTNYDADGVEITLTGCNNGVTDYSSSRSAIPNGQLVKFDDIEHIQERDDLYTLNAKVTDRAGNVYEDSVMFSVNRFGSVYILGDETQKLVDKYYAKHEIPLEVREINVDTLEFQEITYSKDGDIITLEEGTDFSVQESGSEASWKEYKYTINESNFSDEGAYVVTISSKDRATNQMNNKMKEKDIEFVIDKTKPTVVVTGVEEGGQYTDSSRIVTIDAKDNLLLDKVYAYINGQEQVLEFDTEELMENNGIVTLEIGSSNDWQTLRVVVTDAAGNDNKLEKDEQEAEQKEGNYVDGVRVVRFLITTNLFYQWYRNTAAFYGTIAGIVALFGFFWFLIFLKRRKSEEEEAKSKN